MKQGEKTGFSVKYGEHANIWRVWEIWTREYYDSYARKSVPSEPVGQLVITRDKKFYIDKSSGFNDGYEYFWVDCKSGKWVELTCEEFKERSFYYNNCQDILNGGRFYNVEDAYSAIKAPATCYKPTYESYAEFLRYYYPDYGWGNCSVYVLWNKYNLPIVQIREKVVKSKVECKVEWDIAYPGDKEYTPLHCKSIFFNLQTIARMGFAIVEQVHPAECFRTPFPPSECPKKFNPNLDRRNITWSWEMTHSFGESHVPIEELECTGPWRV